MDKQIIEYLKLTLLIFPIAFLTSCDAMLHMTYTVQNKTESDINLFIPNFPTDSVLSIYSGKRDTVLVIKPNQEVIVGIGSKIDFPCRARNIYKNQPGICGIKRINNGEIIELGCTKKDWKYKRRNSKMKIETNP